MTDEEKKPDPSQQGSGAEELKRRVDDALKTCYDPEIPVDIYELGLIYDIAIAPSNDVVITMTLTSPHCPVAEVLPRQVEHKVEGVAGVASVRVDVTWEPEWTPDMMSDVARLDLNL